MRQYPVLTPVISVTTRWPARDDELFGKNYYFIDQERFSWLKNTQQLVESTFVYGDHYGTLGCSLDAALNSGKTPILTVDPRGVETYQQLGYTAHVIFLDFPSAQTQKEHIFKRQPDINPEQLDERLAEAAEERAWANAHSQQPNFAIIVNDKLGACVHDVANALGL